jgi:ribonuclease G
VSTEKNGAPGDQPAKAPDAQDAAEAKETGGDAEATPRRRRGNRGGRRHKRPAAAAAPPETAQAQTQTSSPRDGYTSAASSLADLPTAPLIPVGAADQGAQAKEVVVEAGPSATSAPSGGEATVAGSSSARTGRSRGGRGRRKPKAAEPVAAGATTEPAPAPETREAAVSAAAAETTTEPETSAEVTEQADEGEETPAKRRRRGSRGGRRRRKTADIEHEEAAREAEEAAGEPAGAGTAADEAAEAAAPPVDETAETGAGAEGAADAATGGDGAKSRRRGGRGGRRTRGKRDEAPKSAEEPVASQPPDQGGEATLESKTGEAPGTATRAKARPRDRRRPKAIVRQDEGSGLGTFSPIELGQHRGTVVAEKPDRKIILVTDDGEELRVALVEDGRLAEIYIERPDRKSYLGDIYQGKVENVMNGIDAAFVDFGLEKNGFLYVDEVTTPEGEKRARRIGDALKNGQQVLVQVTKDPMGHKGARLSTKISLAGRYLVYVPGGSGVGVSRRLRQGERERLRDISKELKPKNAGLIVRTIAEGHGLEDLRRDMRYLSRLWSRLKKKADTVKAPGLVHKEVDISLEVTRDLFNDTCESLIVDDPKRHKAILSFLDKEAPELLPKVHLHTGDEPLFTAYGIEEEIAKALERRVPLPSGGNLVIDHAEALTVIDVNTGRFTRGKGLEDTITKTNLEAAREVVRQLRLRDIGGIIIIDAIDMAHAKNREMVLATLEAELETDRTKTYVVELSPLGLIEMTRQNTTDGARGILTRACPTCQGKARVLSDETMALSVERRVRALARKSQSKAWLIEVNAGVAERLNGARLKRLEKLTDRRVFLEGGSSLPVDSFRVISEGSVAHVQEQRVPVREGQEVTVELEFSLTYSPRDAVGYVDGYMVIVEGGRQHLGKRRKVRITDIARTGARATVLKKDVKGDKDEKDAKDAN